MLIRAQSRYERGLTLGLIAALAALAWILTVSLGTALMPGMGSMSDMKPMSGMTGMTPMAGMADRAQSASSPTWVMSVGLFLVSWVIMTTAMMLPTTMRMVDTFGRLASARPRAHIRIASFVLGYVLTWSGIGLIAYLANLVVEPGVDGSMWLMDHRSLMTAGALVLAGLYQLTPLKLSCLRSCRSPLGFLINHWRDGPVGALRMGAHHGIVCIGCCWALMLLMLAVGMAQLGWMIALALLMFVEKVVRRGELIGRGVGIVLLASGVTTAVAAAGILRV